MKSLGKIAVCLTFGSVLIFGCKNRDSAASLQDAAGSAGDAGNYYTTLGVKGSDPMIGVRGISLMTLKTTQPFQSLFPDVVTDDPKNPVNWTTLKAKLNSSGGKPILGIPTWAFLRLVNISKSDSAGDFVKAFFTEAADYDKVVAAQQAKTDTNAFAALAYDPANDQDVSTSKKMIQTLNAQIFQGKLITAADIAAAFADLKAPGTADGSIASTENLGIPQLEVVTTGPDASTGAFRMSFKVNLPVGGSRTALSAAELTALAKIPASSGELMDTFIPKLAATSKTITEVVSIDLKANPLNGWKFFFDSKADAPGVAGADLASLFQEKKSGFAELQTVMNTKVFPSLYQYVGVKGGAEPAAASSDPGSCPALTAAASAVACARYKEGDSSTFTLMGCVEGVAGAVCTQKNLADSAQEQSVFGSLHGLDGPRIWFCAYSSCAAAPRSFVEH